MTTSLPGDGDGSLAHRHPATLQLLRFFEFEHLAPHLRGTSRECYTLAHAMVRGLSDGPELTTGLRKLLEAKDCFVRAALDAPRAGSAGLPGGVPGVHVPEPGRHVDVREPGTGVE